MNFHADTSSNCCSVSRGVNPPREEGTPFLEIDRDDDHKTHPERYKDKARQTVSDKKMMI